MMNICFVIVVLCRVFQLIFGENLNCEFGDWRGYRCVVTTLNNTNNSIVITGHSGTHKPNKTDTDVEKIWIHDTNTKFIPKNLGLLFNLNSFAMWSTKLVEIKSQDFIGMQDLEELDLSSNKLTSIPVDVFSTLTKLMFIHLTNNELEEIPNGVFDNNLQLVRIELSVNYIGIIGSTLFSGLTKLNILTLATNFCINENYKLDGSRQISKLKYDIKRKCNDKNPSVMTQYSSEENNREQDRINMLERKNDELQQRNCKLEKEVSVLKNEMENSVKERDHCYIEKENIIKALLKLNTKSSSVSDSLMIVQSTP